MTDHTQQGTLLRNMCVEACTATCFRAALCLKDSFKCFELKPKYQPSDRSLQA